MFPTVIQRTIHSIVLVALGPFGFAGENCSLKTADTTLMIRVEAGLAVTNPNQHDWFARDYPPNWKPSDFAGATVCLGDEAARQWRLNELRRIVKDYRLDLLEHDQVMIVDHCVRTNHAHTASPTDVAYHAARGYYPVCDELRKENPRLLFENCVNGGELANISGALSHT
jgi:hypothetical protein